MLLEKQVQAFGHEVLQAGVGVDFELFELPRRLDGDANDHAFELGVAGFGRVGLGGRRFGDTRFGDGEVAEGRGLGHIGSGGEVGGDPAPGVGDFLGSLAVGTQLGDGATVDEGVFERSAAHHHGGADGQLVTGECLCGLAVDRAAVAAPVENDDARGTDGVENGDGFTDGLDVEHGRAARYDAQVGQAGGVCRRGFGVRRRVDEHQVDAVGPARLDGAGERIRLRGQHQRIVGLAARRPFGRGPLRVGVDDDDAARPGALRFDGIVERERGFAHAAFLSQ